MSDLRTLAQAYLHAREVDAVSVDLTASREVTRAGLALGAALGTPSTVPPAAHAAAIIAALDAERAQGYARAMGDANALLKAEAQSAVDKARASNDPTKEGYSMAVRDMRAAVRGLATKQAAAVERD